MCLRIGKATSKSIVTTANFQNQAGDFKRIGLPYFSHLKSQAIVFMGFSYKKTITKVVMKGLNCYIRRQAAALMRVGGTDRKPCQQCSSRSSNEIQKHKLKAHFWNWSK